MKGGRAEIAPLAPGAVIGILGGGQLGRMTALAAARLGYRTHVFCQSAEEPAAQVTPYQTLAAFEDEEALKRFAAAVSVITFEFESIPLPSLSYLENLRPIFPDPRILAICSDRIAEKRFLAELGIATAAFLPVANLTGLKEAYDTLGGPALLKSARLGYDGKGQALIESQNALKTDELEAAWRSVAAHAPESRAILEAFVPLSGEISVILARTQDGAQALYEPAQNLHKDGILRKSEVPAVLSPTLLAQAQDWAGMIAESLGLVGVLGVEFFVTTEEKLLVNELAPRPHNSGHWTLDGAATSQFEQLVRALVGLPLGPTTRHFRTVMENLIGEEVARAAELMSAPQARLHLYGKQESRPGRKMGHVNWLFT